MLLKTRRVVVNAPHSVQSVAGDTADYTMTHNSAYGLSKIKTFLPKDFQADTCIYSNKPAEVLPYIFPVTFILA